MADDPRHTRPDLSRGLEPEDAPKMDFFELLRQLEGDGLRFGRSGGPEREPARWVKLRGLILPRRMWPCSSRGTESEPPFVGG